MTKDRFYYGYPSFYEVTEVAQFHGLVSADTTAFPSTLHLVCCLEDEPPGNRIMFLHLNDALVSLHFKSSHFLFIEDINAEIYIDFLFIEDVKVGTTAN